MEDPHLYYDVNLVGTANNVTTFAANEATAGKSVTYFDTDDVAVGTVPTAGAFTSVSGITTNNGLAKVQSGAAVTIFPQDNLSLSHAPTTIK